MHAKRLRMAGLAGLVLAVGLSQAAAGQLGSRSAEEWIDRLDRPARVEGLRIDEVVARLRLDPGDVVADLGAGTGTFSLPFAKAVSPGGRVYAVEIDEDLIDYIAERSQAEGITNVQPVFGEFEDPRLPGRDVDVAFFHDVLHHIEKRAEYLNKLTRYIKPSGRVAIIERGAERGAPGNDPAMHLTQDQVTMWMAEAGFKLSEQYYLFGDDKWFLVYSRQ